MSDSSVWELKETAKWSSDSKQKKDAIAKLSSLGVKALPSLQEVLDVTTYEDVKTACMEAIKSINGGDRKRQA